ncbi:multiple monosaccharide ABC transporter permease [Tessaracoccus antarcticus]|uniref:Xylose transport system permease protein XylH n=1 Tax=Tessaracoccus antarcticus TaxID=2479848 RepID=A0A3M0G7C6_9ACTN|nr:multiple monosaccharide ABC transporter permease [Tessaracoccus antarcticus]RMB58272.1 sugar ABC transporter permease [Tessaracoccus antarcticus]
MSTETTAPIKKAREKGIVSYLMSQLRTVGLLVAFLVLLALMQFLTDGSLLTPQNITSVLNGNSYILILAIGMVMVIIAGHIDLSVGSVVALIGAVTGVITVTWGLPWWVAVIGGLFIGCVVGAWQGIWVAYVGIPAFIVTLGGMLTFRGLAQITLGNIPITPFPDSYVAIGAGFLPRMGERGVGVDPITMAIGAIVAAVLVVLEVRERMGRQKLGLEQEPQAWFIVRAAVTAAFILLVAWQLSQYAGIPIIVVVLGVLVAIYTTVMNRSVFGRSVYARGGNLTAAKLSGINTKKIDFLLFVNNGFIGAIAGIAFTARSNSAGPNAGNMFELDAIAACFIGGAAVTGGVGTVIGAMLGGLIMATLNFGMYLMGLGSDVQQFIKGLVLLAAVAFDVFNKSRGVRN